MLALSISTIILLGGRQEERDMQAVQRRTVILRMIWDDAS